jgi:FADH2 O2-dependent halogenase
VSTTETRVDVIILGGGISASITALCLTAQGISVAIVDTGQHPRFALGESLLKPTVYWMRLLAERFNVPQLNILASLDKITADIAPTSGAKKCFGFVRHEAGNTNIVDRWWSNIPIDYETETSEGHLFRQDIDAYLFNQATEACQLVIPGAKIDAIDISSNSVNVIVNDKSLTAKYLIDCAGYKSPIAEKFTLRETPPRFKTNSRSIFTHMNNVNRFDDCDSGPQPAIDWHDGTLHHILDDAWVWVIPFNNHENSRNPLVSVGVTFTGKLLQNGKSPEQEWTELLIQYPALGLQFSTAKIVRPWIGTGRLSYSSKQATGKRYCLFGQSYGGIDALYSRGLLNTMQSIYLLTNTVRNACNEDDFDCVQFKKIDNLQAALLEINDLLTHGSYCGFNSSILTTWWLSIWTLVEKLSITHVQPPLTMVMSSSNNKTPKNWFDFDSQFDGSDGISQQNLVLDFLRKAVNLMEQYRRQELPESSVHEKLLIMAQPLQILGFDYTNYSALLKKFGFARSSRDLLQTEHELVGIVQIIDKHTDKALNLRTNPLLRSLIRLISLELTKSKRTTMVSKEQAISLSLTSSALQDKLRKIIEQGMFDPTTKHSTLQKSREILTVTYLKQDVSAQKNDVKEHDSKCLLRFHDNDYHIEISIKRNAQHHVTSTLCVRSSSSYQEFSVLTEKSLGIN